jgi:ABC-type multidrug transport system fused ATPase/permease subunit
MHLHKSAFSLAVAVLFKDLGTRLGGAKASKSVHNAALRAMLRAPTSFLDITPMGRIVSRFSSDMFVVDAQMPLILAHFLGLSWQVSLPQVVLENIATPAFIFF